MFSSAETSKYAFAKYFIHWCHTFNCLGKGNKCKSKRVNWFWRKCNMNIKSSTTFSLFSFLLFLPFFKSKINELIIFPTGIIKNICDVFKVKQKHYIFGSVATLIQSDAQANHTLTICKNESTRRAPSKAIAIY